MRKILAIWAAKLAIAGSKLLGKNGSSTPGTIALKICPDILSKLSGDIGKDIVAVWGTNGKTTTNNMILTVLENQGSTVVCNKVGSNMLSGVVTAFIDYATLGGKVKADYACLEMDEAYARIILKYVTPTKIVITNLFRDQMDRYGEIDTTIEYIKEALGKAEDSLLVLNGDDPLTASLGLDHKNTVYYGISENLGLNLNETREGRYCRVCGNELHYDFYQYGQLGKYHCDKCGFSRPAPNYDGSNIQSEDYVSFDVNGVHVDLPCKGIYNIYNALAAYAFADKCGIPSDKIAEGLQKYKGQAGRMEEFTIKGKLVVFNLAKNPASFNRSISNILSEKRTKDVVIGINDNDPDGNDVSWLWDVDFEQLLDTSVKSCTATGIRSKDMAVRLKYCDIPKENITEDGNVKAAIMNAVNGSGERVYIVVNYTLLFSTKKILQELEEEYK
ncbi:MAG: Mur ligase family protein [Clostridia bacterium]|nr:Mur ligase family protein [Clostridia bacterium]